MKPSLAIFFALMSSLAASRTWAQNVQMMNDGVWGGGWMAGYGVLWGLCLLVIVAVLGGVAWAVKRK